MYRYQLVSNLGIPNQSATDIRSGIMIDASYDDADLPNCIALFCFVTTETLNSL